MEGQRGDGKAAYFMMYEEIKMLFLLGSMFGIIKKVIGKGIEHAIAKDGRGAVLRQPVLLPENGIDHEIAQGLTHILRLHFRCKAADLPEKVLHGSLKGDQAVLRHGSANTQDRFVKQEPVKQRFHFLCPFLQLGRRGLGIGGLLRLLPGEGQPDRNSASGWEGLHMPLKPFHSSSYPGLVVSFFLQGYRGEKIGEGVLGREP